MLESIAPLLLEWFSCNGRSSLPWRADRSPYAVLVSEFMLQQTQVERVVPVYRRFVAMWPSFEELAAASQADVVRAWKGLGYNGRAVRLHRLARAVCASHGGVLPRGEDALRALPGIGAYTARAIAAFAFDADVAAVDTNVRRIVHRTQLGMEWPARESDSQLDARATALVPPGYGFAFNSALMDLGASVCTARAPKCLLCPLQTVCAAAPIDAAGLAALAAAHRPAPALQARLRFEQTARYARGRIVDRLRALPPGEAVSLLSLRDQLALPAPHHERRTFEDVVARLSRDGVVEQRDGALRLAEPAR